MSKKSIPIYVICGSLSSGKTTFIQKCLNRREEKANALIIQFEMGLESFEQAAVYIPIRDVQSLTNIELADRIAASIAEAAPDEIWIEWNGMLPIRRLLTLLHTQPLAKMGKLSKILQMADSEEYLSLLSQEGSVQMEQVIQCDLVVLRGAGEKETRMYRRSLKQVHAGIYVLDESETRQIDSLLYYPNVKETIRIMSVLTVGVAAISLLSFLNISIPKSITVFLGTWLQAIPFLLLGILLSSLIQVFVSPDFIRRVFPKNVLSGMLFGMIGGFFLPVCDCASIPVFRSLVKKGVPLPAAVTFLTAAPVINPVVMLSTYYAFGANAKVVLLRVLLGMLASLVIGLFFLRKGDSIFTSGIAQNACACCQLNSIEEKPVSKPMQLAAHFRNELFEVAKYLLMGIAVSTFFQMVLAGSLIRLGSMNLLLSMLLMMGMAFLLSLCSSSDAVVGKNMGAGLPMGALMGFMVFGPMMDIKNVIMMSSSMSRRFIVKLLVVTFAVCACVVYAASMLGLEGWIA